MSLSATKIQNKAALRDSQSGFIISMSKMLLKLLAFEKHSLDNWRCVGVGNVID